MPRPGELQFPSALDSLKTLVETANDALTTLTAPLLTTDTVAIVASTAAFPASGFVVIDGEICSYDGKTPTQLQSLVHAEQGTTSTTHSIGANVELQVTARDHNVLAEVAVQIETAIDQSLLSLVWAAPSAESGNAIEIAAQLQSYTGQAFASGLIDVELRLTDAANDYEPSWTATIGPAASPLGSLMSGLDTATVTMRTNASGQFKIRVSEASAGSRYLFTKGGGNARYYVRARDGVQQLIFA